MMSLFSTTQALTRKPLNILWLFILIAIPATGYAQDALPRARLITSGASTALTTTRERRASVPAKTEIGNAARPVPVEIAILERRAFALINAERAKNGESPLVWDEELCAMAREHSHNMATRQFFNHVTPEGLDMLGRARARGIRGWKAIGENIALNQGYGDPATFAVDRWMESPKHRMNILYPGFNRSAIGIARASDGTFYLTQEFMIR